MLRNYEVKGNGVGSLHSNQKQVLSTKMKNRAYTTATFSYSKWRHNGCQNINISQNTLFE